MSKSNSWLTIDRLNGMGNATVALTASELSTIGERNLTIKVNTLTKSSEINVLQKFYEEPLIPENIPNNQIWAKSTDGSEIAFNVDIYDFDFNVSLIDKQLRSDGWNIFTFDGDVPYLQSKRFFNKTNVQEVVLPNSISSIQFSAFEGCTSLTSIKFPDNITDIEARAFQKCTSLTSINLPDNITYIGYNAFEKCQSLTSINLPDRLNKIDNEVFSGCSSLTSIIIPDNVTSIGYASFSECSSLASIEFGSGLTYIGSSAFNSCIGLNEMKFKGVTAPRYESNTFRGIKRDGVFYYPSGSDYSSLLRWQGDVFNLGYYNWTSVPY